MKTFYIEYGCGCGTNHEVVRCKDIVAAQDYAYQMALEDYDSFAGLHGIQDIDEVCEDYGIEDINSEEAWEAYHEVRENTIDWFAVEFDENNEEHIDVLDTQGGEIIDV